MYCMSEYKNNKSEAFTAVISLISLYNSVACHETHTHSYSSTCIHTHTQPKTTFSSLRWEESSHGHETQVTSLVKDGKGEKVKTHAHKKEKTKIYVYICGYIYIYIYFSKGRLPSISISLESHPTPHPRPPNKPKTL